MDYDKYANQYEISKEEISNSIEQEYVRPIEGVYLLKFSAGGLSEKDFKDDNTGEITSKISAKMIYIIEGSEEELGFIGLTMNHFHNFENHPNYTTNQKIGNLMKHLGAINYVLADQYHQKIKEAETSGEVFKVIDECLTAFTDAANTFKCNISYRKGKDGRTYTDYKVVIDEE